MVQASGKIFTRHWDVVPNSDQFPIPCAWSDCPGLLSLGVVLGRGGVRSALHRLLMQLQMDICIKLKSSRIARLRVWDSQPPRSWLRYLWKESARGNARGYSSSQSQLETDPATGCYRQHRRTREGLGVPKFGGSCRVLSKSISMAVL